MAGPRERVRPQTFFLNESHELALGEKGGGGPPPRYVGISWAARGRHLSSTLSRTIAGIQASRDPLRADRYFVVAQPVPELEKESKDKRKAPTGTFKDPTDFGGVHGRIFDRLGFDLLHVTDDGRAVVHGTKQTIDQLVQRTANLETLGAREQGRWATIESFDVIPVQLRFDDDWFKSIRSDVADVVIELQPVLSRVEADQVIRAVADLLAQGSGEKLLGGGTDFSGRYWFRGRASQRSIRNIAKEYFSVQSLHSPLRSIAAAGRTRVGERPTPTRQVPVAHTVDISSLPCVAILDLGIPTDHKQLARYRRGQFIPQDAARGADTDHATFVASRVVFGDCGSDEEVLDCEGQCTFYDAVVADYPSGTRTNLVNDKIVMDALRGVRGAARDVRVFNLSFGDVRPVADLPAVERREKLLLLQDLDNFIFSNDSLVVVASGNSAPGVQPSHDYPDHHNDPRWALGAWACGYNTLVCGAYVSKISADGLVNRVGWPSAFSRIGPGHCDSPIPSFGAAGGDTDENYNSSPGLGVWGLSEAGMAEDRIGTSHAAPLLAREAALAFQALQQFCLPGSQPFAVLVRAFFALTAVRTSEDEEIQALAKRTLGFGVASARRLTNPSAGSAVILWQGYIESKDDKVRVQLPIPLAWLNAAEKPVLRVALCYDPPVNQAAPATWACRKVRAVLHLNPDGASVRAPSGGHESYPLAVRDYKLDKFKEGEERAVEGDMWLLEISYDEIAPYAPAMDFDGRQRVAIAAELIDRGENPADPQAAMQALPMAVTMTRLSVQPAPIRAPVIVRTRRS